MAHFPRRHELLAAQQALRLCQRRQPDDLRPWYYMYRWDAYQPFGTDENGRPLRSPATEIALANTANRENSYLNTNVGMTVNLTDNWHINLDYTFAKEDLTINRPGTKFTMANTWEKGIERLDADGNGYTSTAQVG